ncbi:LPXTG cell wall anchor domain-containing protein [Candidatus Enterococcus ferrettii]|uniref:Gram-positive cocci surface proteins LPxTG domain-containing protein n=1 Tax=Candidatus Enterococcus ferrettii TaxID=2815324 RepID=A0ABV0EJL9_9ENTE|nr:LPXTG cell wall anchor domain-containing protein [Enterococcus sp. 665A]MBO1339043.1 LPXTG cell wall anchor domain-containing protein [Enterococcus sp. 665A]
MNMRRILIGILSLFVLFSGSPAAEAAKTLPPGLVIGDSEGMYATSEGDYYIDLMGILPGEVYEKEITIRGLDLEDPFSLGLLVEEVGSNGSIFWKEHITLTLILDEKEIYQGPILGDGSFDWSKTPLELGVCKYGTDKLLLARFTMDAHLTNEDLREQSKLEFYWTFVGTKDQPKEPTKPTEPTTPTQTSEPTIPSSPGGSGNLPSTGQGIPSNRKLLPQTGEQIVYMFLSGLLLVMITLFLWKKRQEEEQE